jgi:AcrR family transcriptional regulator
MNDRSSRLAANGPAVVGLLDAVERIFTTESPSTVSMRTIAKEADCSLGLAYNYFASKEELIGAALDRMAKRITADATTNTDDPREALRALINSMRTNAAFPRLMTWLLLEGHDLSSVMSGFPLEKSVTAIAAERGVEDPESVAMTMGLLAIGVFTYGEVLNGAVGRDPGDEQLVDFLSELFASLFPQPMG